MTRTRILMAVVAAALLAGGALIWLLRPRQPSDLLTLQGNVDLRQVELAFNNSDRITAVFAQEGDRVARGQLLANLDTSRLQAQLAQAEGQTAAQAALVAKMHAGNRPQEIAQAKAARDLAAAEAVNAQRQYERASTLWSASAGHAAVSRQNLDDAQTALKTAEARLAAQGKAYDLELAGFRREDVAQAEGQLKADQGQLALIQRELADTRLTAPVAGVIRARLLEPGEMATPQRPVFTIAKTDPKWVRAYASETDLPRLRPGAKAEVSVDGFPGRAFPGWVGFISSVAEFTPKTVQTPELRTSLVYEVRVFVNDPHDDLRLGMPATVRIHLEPREARR
jgi:HlyD family secretion protein